jgi:antitoxin MazE
MATQMLKKWGNSTAVRLSAGVMEAANLTIDQAVDVRAEPGRVIIEAAAPVYQLDDLLDGITPENRHGEVDTGKALLRL